MDASSSLVCGRGVLKNQLLTVNLLTLRREVFLECLVVVLAVAQFAVDEADEFYGCLEAELLVAGHKTLIPQLIEELKKLGREDIMVIAGGVIPAQDYDFLYKAGVAAIFGPGTSVAKAACEMMNILLDK